MPRNQTVRDGLATSTTEPSSTTSIDGGVRRWPATVVSCMTVALAFGTVLTACGQAAPPKPLETLQVQSTGLPPGLRPTIVVTGDGHVWLVARRQETLRLLAGRYRVRVQPTSSDGWTYRPSDLSQAIEVPRERTLRVVESYELWPTGEPADAAWTEVSTDTPDGPDLDATNLSCVGKSFCIAIGSVNGSDGSGDLYQWLWNGDVWSTAQDTGLPVTDVNSLDCPSDSFCVMGTGSPQYAAPTEVAVWNGHHWTAESPAGSGQAYLYVASCSTPRNCLAVAGLFGVSPLGAAYQWNGHGWKTVAAPRLVDEAGLGLIPGELTCPYEGSADFCLLTGVANGAGISAGQLAGTAWIWKGGAWEVQSAIDGGFVAGCRGASDCVILGGTEPSPSTYTSTVYTWYGQKWIPQSYPDGPYQVQIDQPLQCLGSQLCFAGGDLIGSTPGQATQLLEWNGAAWRAVGSNMDSATSIDGFNGNLVSCAPDDYCLDIGTAGSFSLS